MRPKVRCFAIDEAEGAGAVAWLCHGRTQWCHSGAMKKDGVAAVGGGLRHSIRCILWQPAQVLKGHLGKQDYSPRSCFHTLYACNLTGPVCCCALHHVHAVCVTREGKITESVQVLLSRGQAAVEAIAAAPDATSRRDADAFDQLQIIRRMMEKAKQQHWDGVLQVRERLDRLHVSDLAVGNIYMCAA